MKTSNKILIAFAVVMFIVPIVTIAISINTDSPRITSDEWTNTSKLNVKTTGYISKAIEKPFNGVILNNGLSNKFIELRLVEGEESGIKMPGNIQDKVSFNVDPAGKLQITFDDQGDDLRYSIIVYSKSLKTLNVANTDALVVKADLDSLEIHAEKSGTLSFNGDHAKIKNLNLTANNVMAVQVDRDDSFDFLNVKLENSQFFFDSNSVSGLVINASGKSNIDIKTDGQPNDFNIGKLEINTLGDTQLLIKNIKVGAFSGKFSDNTSVNMPASYLNQMISKK
ncbi:GIN domain-containing protein [Pedobacter metabolipauper]|uniref:Uncharacterized protein n=1 Tax=Pedobacter metabolipauper TaxID=425513 RepID=A0A4R6SZB1_9SPHI|nr:DUF2807 domain-containing protein [Pedobacter metabolipauper]TDQ09875.1 hypothetical protein ATK78_2034 [Pedobacter metabolipauper]